MGRVASIATLARFAISQKMTNITYTNKRSIPTMGVWKAMWRWASLKENKDTAYQIFQDYVKEYGWKWERDFTWLEGQEVDLDHWKAYMRRIIRSAWQFNENRYQRFLQDNEWN